MIPNPSSELEGRLIASELILAAEISCEDAEETQLLRAMFDEASRYVASFSWCTTMKDSYFGGGVGRVFAVFFFHIQPSRSDVDPWIWVMVGDVPSAYLPVTDCKSPGEAFRTYLAGMKKWCELARLGKEGTAEQGVPPINVPASPEWAEELSKRLQMLEFLLKPFFEAESDTLA